MRDMATGDVTYKDFKVGDVTVTVMRVAYPYGHVFYKHRIGRSYKGHEGKRKTSPWLEYGADEGSEAAARRKATQWVRQQQIKDQKERAEALPADFDNEI